MKIIDAVSYFGAPPPTTPERAEQDRSLEEELLRCGVSGALSLSTTGIFYDHREGNDETLRFARNASLRIIPAGTVDLRKYYGGEVAALKELGFKALRLPNSFQAWGFDYAPFWLAVREATKAELPLVVDLGGLGSASSLARACSARSLTVIATHLTYSILAEVICVMKDWHSLHVCTDHLSSPDAIEIIVREVGADRVLFGSGAPFSQVEPPLLVLESAKLTAAEREAIASENLIRVLGL